MFVPHPSLGGKSIVTDFITDAGPRLFVGIGSQLHILFALIAVNLFILPYLAAKAVGLTVYAIIYNDPSVFPQDGKIDSGEDIWHYQIVTQAATLYGAVFLIKLVWDKWYQHSPQDKSD